MFDKRKLFTESLVLGALFFLPTAYPSAADAPEFIELASISNIYEPVSFDHEMHMNMTSCATCHHHIIGMPPEDKNCLQCHKEGTSADDLTCGGCHAVNPGSAEKVRESKERDMYHYDLPGLKRAYHVKCLGCHKEMEVDSGCEDCHPRKTGSNVASVAE